MAEVRVAKSAGFCYGVERAVKLAEETAREKGGCAMLGSIIHNVHVVAELEALGARQVDSVEEVRPGETVIIRSHGERKEVFDRLEQLGAVCVNATCPNVLRIQQLVAQADREGRIPLIIGEPRHPEVMGVASWSDRSVIFPGPEELEKWLLQEPSRQSLSLTAVAQTTCIRTIWETSKEILKKLCTNAKIFDTICSATHRRQLEAAELAAQADVMVVVGDRKSANTKHLAEICRKACPVVYQIEQAGELTTGFLSGCTMAGLTAGASTPAGIIKEVYTTMSEEIKNMEPQEESFEELLDKSFKTLNTGEKVTGIVTAVGPTEVQVDLGCKQAGYISAEELSADPSVKPEDVVKGVRVFVPASQSGQPRGADLSQMIGQTVSLRITEVNRARRRVVGSIRAVQYEERQAAQAAIWESIEVGKHCTGTVKSMTSYGVFVDIGGVDGMVHISELSWSRIKNPAEVVSVGDTLDVYVISFDPEKHKISLGVKDRSCNPWDKFMETYKVGDVASVRIVKLMTFGAFAEVVPGVDGLIHISQIADRRIEKPGDVLSEGQIVDAKITAVDEEKQKISLSIRALLNDGDEDAE